VRPSSIAGSARPTRHQAVESELRLEPAELGDADLGPISPELALIDPVLAERARQALPERPELPAPAPRDQLPAVETEPLVGFAELSDADLGPVSPELALIDPVLAVRARQALPERPELSAPRGRSATQPASTAPSSELPKLPSAAPPSVSRRARRLRRTVVLAVLVFASGAVVGGSVGERGASPVARFELRAALPAAPTGRTATTQLPERQSHSAGLPTSRRPSLAHRSRHRRASNVSGQRQRAALAENVLGVASWVGRPGLTLSWQRPANSGHVVVLRSLPAQRRSVVVYRGRATSYRKASVRPCTAYRYIIVNYDRRGRRSTGVPTSIVTGGCG
jgi:hypothetical protein